MTPTKFGETAIMEDNKLYFSARESSLPAKNMVNTVMRHQLFSSLIITICPRAAPFSLMLLQAYAPTSKDSDTDVEDFYDLPREVVEHASQKTF